jgi:hypothetical protein
MENLQPDMKSKPLIHLAIPGAHDCMTYTIKSNAEMSPDNNPTVVALLKVFGSLGQRYMHKWCITQDMTIGEQLNSGMRYMDFRCATKPDDSNIYFCHGLYGDEVSDYLGMVNEFLDENRGEVVILDFQHFYGFTKEHHNKLIHHHIKGTFHNKLCPYNGSEIGVTLDWMIKLGYRAIVIYRDKNIEDQKIAGLWPGPAFPTYWPNTTSTNTLLNFVQGKLKLRDSSKGFVTQCVLTPDGPMVAENLFSNLRRCCAIPVSKKLGPWLQKQHSGPSGLNVVIADFVNDGNIPNIIIDLNQHYAE